MQPIPVPKEIVVPLTIALLATVVYLLRDINKGKGLGVQIWNIIQGAFGILAALWLIINVLLNVTGAAWSRFLANEYMGAFMSELTIDVSSFPEWFTILVAIGLFYMALKVSAGAGTSVWGKIGNILLYYVAFLLVLGVLSPIIFGLVNAVAKSFLSNQYILSLLQALGIIAQ